MGAYVVRRILYNIPVFLGILLIVMMALRVQDPISLRLGKHATQQDYIEAKEAAGLDRPFVMFDLDVGVEVQPPIGRLPEMGVRIAEVGHERGVLGLSGDWLLRLRHNPFYDFLEERVLEWVEVVEESHDGA